MWDQTLNKSSYETKKRLCMKWDNIEWFHDIESLCISTTMIQIKELDQCFQLFEGKEIIRVDFVENVTCLQIAESWFSMIRFAWLMIGTKIWFWLITTYSLFLIFIDKRICQSNETSPFNIFDGGIFVSYNHTTQLMTQQTHHFVVMLHRWKRKEVSKREKVVESDFHSFSVMWEKTHEKNEDENEKWDLSKVIQFDSIFIISTIFRFNCSQFHNFDPLRMG